MMSFAPAATARTFDWRCQQLLLCPAFVLLAMIAVVPARVDAQNARPAADRSLATLAGIVYDPLGQPAEDTIVTLIGMTGLDTRQARSDASGRYRFEAVPAGRYGLTTPISDIVDPPIVEVRAGQAATIDIRIAVDETAVNMRVCRDCRTPASVTAPGGGTAAEPIAGVVASARPVEGWDAFNAAVFPYPDALKASRAEGTVAVEARINPDGTTFDAHLTGAPNAMLAAAALALVQQQRWQPAQLRGIAVQAPLHATVEFSLKGEDW